MGTLAPARPRAVRELQTGDVAEALGVSREFVTRLIGRGRIRAKRTPGGHYRVTRYELKRILDGGLREPSAPT